MFCDQEKKLMILQLNQQQRRDLHTLLDNSHQKNSKGTLDIISFMHKKCDTPHLIGS